MDAQIWYAIFSTICGGIHGAFNHLGEVSGCFYPCAMRNFFFSLVLVKCLSLFIVTTQPTLATSHGFLARGWAKPLPNSPKVLANMLSVSRTLLQSRTSWLWYHSVMSRPHVYQYYSCFGHRSLCMVFFLSESPGPNPDPTLPKGLNNMLVQVDL